MYHVWNHKFDPKDHRRPDKVMNTHNLISCEVEAEKKMSSSNELEASFGNENLSQKNKNSSNCRGMT